jgi:hypothetical protein
MHRRWKALIAAAGMVALLAGTSLAADAPKKPDATLKLTEGSVAAGIGWSWGHGTLSYKGKTYKVKVEGLSVGEVGVTKATATGNVYNLKSLDDFTGTYGAAGAEFTAGQGKGASALVNPKGVQLNLTSTTKGASIKVAAEGLKLTVEK